MTAAAKPELEPTSEDELTSLVRRWITTPRASTQDRTCNMATTRTLTTVRPPTSLPSRHSELVDPCGHSDLASIERDPAEETVAPAGLDTRRSPEVSEVLAWPSKSAQRIAMLVDAWTTPPETADGLLEVLAGIGSVTVRRGYADWTRPDMGDWLGLLRRHGIQPVHHFSDEGAERDDGQALVSMSVDAVDLAHDFAVDVVVIVGNPDSMVPLIARLHASGVLVVAVGPESTSFSVRAQSDDFIDFAVLTARTAATRTGRHRA